MVWNLKWVYAEIRVRKRHRGLMDQRKCVGKFSFFFMNSEAVLAVANGASGVWNVFGPAAQWRRALQAASCAVHKKKAGMRAPWMAFSVWQWLRLSARANGQRSLLRMAKVICAHAHAHVRLCVPLCTRKVRWEITQECENTCQRQRIWVAFNRSIPLFASSEGISQSHQKASPVSHAGWN